MTEGGKLQAMAILKKEAEKHPDGYTVYFDYRDKISPITFANAIERYRDALEHMNEEYKKDEKFISYLEAQVEEDWDLIDTFGDTLKDNFYYDKSTEETDLINDYLEEECLSLEEALAQSGFNGVSYDIHDIIGEYHLNIMLGSDRERNYDMGSIPSTYMRDKEAFVESAGTLIEQGRFDNALTYLITQQGYKPAEVIQASYRYIDDNPCNAEPPASAFIKSTAEEIGEFPGYSMAELTALVTINSSNLDVIDRIVKGEGYLSFNKDTMLGLYNEWQGAGSTLDIKLEKPFDCPASMARSVQVEGQDKSLTSGYTVNETYGLISTCWKGTVTTLNTEPERSSEAIWSEAKASYQELDNIVSEFKDEIWVKKHIVIEPVSDPIYGSDQRDISFPERFATVTFPLVTYHLTPVLGPECDNHDISYFSINDIEGGITDRNILVETENGDAHTLSLTDGQMKAAYALLNAQCYELYGKTCADLLKESREEMERASQEPADLFER